MEEYAKETSIEFFKWNSMLDISEYEKLEERYSLFIKSIEDAKEKV